MEAAGFAFHTSEERGMSAISRIESSEANFPHHVVLNRNNLPGGGDTQECIDIIVKHVLDTKREMGGWRCWLLGGEIKLVFERAEDAVLARLLIDG